VSFFSESNLCGESSGLADKLTRACWLLRAFQNRNVGRDFGPLLVMPIVSHVEFLCSLGEEETDQGHSECKCKAITKALNSSSFRVICIWRVNEAKITEARRSAARLSFGKQLAQCRYIWIDFHTRQEMDNKSSQDYRRNPNKREQLQLSQRIFCS
jgi:hypothetical protein